VLCLHCADSVNLYKRWLVSLGHQVGVNVSFVRMAEHRQFRGSKGEPFLARSWCEPTLSEKERQI